MLPKHGKYDYENIGGKPRVICQWKYLGSKHLFISNPDCFRKLLKYNTMLEKYQEELSCNPPVACVSGRINRIQKKIAKYSDLVNNPRKCARREMHRLGITRKDCVLRMSGEQLIYSYYIRDNVARFAYYYGRFRLWTHRITDIDNMNIDWINLVQKRHQIIIIPDFNKGFVLGLAHKCSLLNVAINACNSRKISKADRTRYVDPIKNLDINVYADYLKILIAKDAMMEMIFTFDNAIQECNDAFIAVRM